MAGCRHRLTSDGRGGHAQRARGRERTVQHVSFGKCARTHSFPFPILLLLKMSVASLAEAKAPGTSARPLCPCAHISRNGQVRMVLPA